MALFWLSDEAWMAIEPHLPKNQPGARRVDDRRVISGILHVLKVCCRWCDCPTDYGPSTTVYNRFKCRLVSCLVRQRQHNAGNFGPDEEGLGSVAAMVGRRPFHTKRSPAMVRKNATSSFVIGNANAALRITRHGSQQLSPSNHARN